MSAFGTLYWKPSGSRLNRGGHSKDLGKLSLAVAIQVASNEAADLVLHDHAGKVSDSLLQRGKAVSDRAGPGS